MVIDQKMNKKIIELSEKYGLSLVVLFGSQATGKTHKDSDIDIAYIAHKKLDFDVKSSLNSDLTGVFGNERVDIVDMKTANPLLLRAIVRDAVVLYEKSRNIFDNIYVYAVKLYEESKPLFELKKYLLDKRLAQYHHA